MSDLIRREDVLKRQDLDIAQKKRKKMKWRNKDDRRNYN